MDSVDWGAINDKLPITKGKEGEQVRLKLFKQMDGNGNRYLSLAETDKGIRDVLNLDEEMFHCKQVIMRAFQAAKNKYKNKSKYGDDYIEFNEFRYFLIYLRQYFEYYVMFCILDTSGDHKIDFEEFKSALPQIEKWGVKVADPQAAFEQISSGDGKIIFNEFAEWAIKASLDLEDDEDMDESEYLK